MPFKPGQSGNPSGRPKVIAEVQALARKRTVKAIRALTKCLDDPDGRVVVAAANALLDRAWGKPAQPLEHSAEITTAAMMVDAVKALSRFADGEEKSPALQ